MNSISGVFVKHFLAQTAHSDTATCPKMETCQLSMPLVHPGRWVYNL